MSYFKGKDDILKEKKKKKKDPLLVLVINISGFRLDTC